MIKKVRILLTIFIACFFVISNSYAGARDNILSGFANQAKAENSSFEGFSAKRGEKLFTTNFALGKPETPACTACHGNTPYIQGETRAGKPIEPMAVSITSDRYSDPKKVAKWFKRNCNSVLGRLCTAEEKGDFITYMMSK